MLFRDTMPLTCVPRLSRFKGTRRTSDVEVTSKALHLYPEELVDLESMVEGVLVDMGIDRATSKDSGQMPMP